ncbi:MAG: hypothetical protein GX029_10470 [Pseudomonadaceae bacterium]|nr:hypothetical protein [Pseudomonadaceae bacterium]
MKWQPSSPIRSTMQPRLDVSSYKKDHKFDFITGEFVSGEWVEGLDAFIQKFIKVLLTKETPVIKYGLAELLPKSQEQPEFEKECEKLSHAIVSHKFSDSTPENLNGLGYAVEEIYSISRERIDGINYIVVELIVEPSLTSILKY